MPYVQKTLNAVAGTGYVVPLGQSCGKVAIQTVGAAAIRFGSGALPATPTGAYVPGAGVTVNSINLPANGEYEMGSDYEGGGFKIGVQEPIEWVALWSPVGAGGHVLIVGH